MESTVCINRFPIHIPFEHIHLLSEKLPCTVHGTPSERRSERARKEKKEMKKYIAVTEIAREGDGEGGYRTTHNKYISFARFSSVFCAPTPVFLFPLSMLLCVVGECTCAWVCMCARIREMRKRSRIPCSNQNKNRIPHTITYIRWTGEKESYDHECALLLNTTKQSSKRIAVVLSM